LGHKETYQTSHNVVLALRQKHTGKNRRARSPNEAQRQPRAKRCRGPARQAMGESVALGARGERGADEVATDTQRPRHKSEPRSANPANISMDLGTTQELKNKQRRRRIQIDVGGLAAPNIWAELIRTGMQVQEN